MLKLITKNPKVGQELKFKRVNYIDYVCYFLAVLVIIINILILFLI